jgi:hypothetical protein
MIRPAVCTSSTSDQLKHSKFAQWMDIPDNKRGMRRLIHNLDNSNVLGSGSFGISVVISTCDILTRTVPIRFRKYVKRIFPQYTVAKIIPHSVRTTMVNSIRMEINNLKRCNEVRNRLADGCIHVPFYYGCETHTLTDMMFHPRLHTYFNNTIGRSHLHFNSKVTLIWMEYVNGSDLARFLMVNKDTSFDIIPLIFQVLHTLMSLQQITNTFRHNDLFPRNILLRQSHVNTIVKDIRYVVPIPTNTFESITSTQNTPEEVVVSEEDDIYTDPSIIHLISPTVTNTNRHEPSRLSPDLTSVSDPLFDFDLLDVSNTVPPGTKPTSRTFVVPIQPYSIVICDFDHAHTDTPNLRNDKVYTTSLNGIDTMVNRKYDMMCFVIGLCQVYARLHKCTNWFDFIVKYPNHWYNKWMHTFIPSKYLTSHYFGVRDGRMNRRMCSQIDTIPTIGQILSSSLLFQKYYNQTT